MLYRVIAERAIREWNLAKNGENAYELANTENIGDLERGINEKLNGIGAIRIINSIVKAITNGVRDRMIPFFEGKTAESVATIFSDTIISGNESDELNTFLVLQNALSQVKDKEAFVLELINCVHNDWIRKFATRETFDKKLSEYTIHHYLNMYFIGWNEVAKDLIIIEPILNAGGMEINLEKLKGEYLTRVEEILVYEKIFNEADFFKLAIRKTEENTPLIDESVSYGWEILEALKNDEFVQKVLIKSSLEKGFGDLKTFYNSRGIIIPENKEDISENRGIIKAVMVEDIIRALKVHAF